MLQELLEAKEKIQDVVHKLCLMAHNKDSVIERDERNAKEGNHRVREEAVRDQLVCQERKPTERKKSRIGLGFNQLKSV